MTGRDIQRCDEGCMRDRLGKVSWRRDIRSMRMAGGFVWAYYREGGCGRAFDEILG